MLPPLSDALAERGFDKLTPVQEAVIAPELAASDLLVSAQTGSGKTVGFGLAIAPTLLGDAVAFGPAATPLALVIAPTRELALQVKHELGWLYARTGAVMASCIGGMDMRQERRALERGAHIVVGTPGRLRDHVERGSLDLGSLRAAVLDEADEMLDLGFREDLEFILGAAPETRRTLLFSATVPPAIVKLAGEFQRDAQRINTLSGTDQHADITYQAVRVSARDSEHAIFNLLRFHHDQSAIVFANTRAQVNHLMARLTNRGLATVSLSGELSQSERTHALQAMRDGRARICVATDVAARGIDLPNLSLVIHADLPTNTESLLHRSGRTGRAGRKGVSALIVPPKATKRAERLLKWAKITAEWTVPPSAEEIQRQDEERLMADPAWDEPVTEDQAAFAAKLLARHGPEAVAAAYLRLYQSRYAAPEDLLPPDSKPEKAPRRDFGPSRWIALSVGRDDRAEPRWLLPLLCRAGNLDKSAIGAIRVQQSETFVELSAPSVDGFLAALGEGGVLEEGIAARALDGAPEMPAREPRGARPAPGPRPAPKGADRPDKPRKATPPHKDGPRKDRKPAAQTHDTPAPAPAGKPEGKKKPKHKPDSRPTETRTKDRDAAKHSARKPGKGSQGGKPGGKPGAKPKGHSKAKPPAPAADARDASKRFNPNKPGKSGRVSSGGNAKPRRTKG